MGASTDTANTFSINFRKPIGGLKIHGFGKINSAYMKRNINCTVLKVEFTCLAECHFEQCALFCTEFPFHTKPNTFIHY